MVKATASGRPSPSDTGSNPGRTAQSAVATLQMVRRVLVQHCFATSVVHAIGRVVVMNVAGNLCFVMCLAVRVVQTVCCQRAWRPRIQCWDLSPPDPCFTNSTFNDTSLNVGFCKKEKRPKLRSKHGALKYAVVQKERL